MREPVPEPAAQDLGPGVAILLAASAVIAAIIAGRSAFLADGSSESWQQAVREEVKRSAAYIEDIRFVYVDEAPAAFRVTEARIRAEELRKAADKVSGQDRALLLVEAGTQANIAQGLAPGSEIATNPKYQTKDGGFDVGRRLADNRAENPELVALDPSKAQAAGDRASRKGVRLVACAILVAVAFLMGSLAQGFARLRRGFLSAGAVFAGLGLLSAVVVEVIG